ncbi:MAG: VWA domain-containing protein [Gammaproteobacteria bacterium]|nr:MAG: VWA domain-containing protein [Gammaproteobacteria bacterium]
MKRRPVSPFSLSFLDIMFCGFGAVVLLVLILNTDTVKARNQTFADLRGEVVKREQQALVGREQLVAARNSLEATERELVVTRGQAERAAEEIRALTRQIAVLRGETVASREHVNRLSADLKQLDSDRQQLGAAPAPEAGDKVLQFRGEGDRQYLTGLRVGGKRILILVDVSASMLDETIINVVRRRNMDEAQKRSAPKWRRALLTTQWLISNLPPTAQFQLYLFNTAARAASRDSQGQWLSASNRDDLERTLTALRDSVPEGGTSLYHALAVAKALSPRPDNILLVTDGLPTQGSKKPGGTTVSADQRLAHFSKAVASLPAGIPVNTILLPMEGDAYAAAAYWKLGVDTGGSFLTPARDWP